MMKFIKKIIIKRLKALAINKNNKEQSKKSLFNSEKIT